MLWSRYLITWTLFIIPLSFALYNTHANIKTINVIAIGHYPDDCETGARGTGSLFAHETQYFEWLPWTAEYLDEVPEDEKSRVKWIAILRSCTPDVEMNFFLRKWYGDNLITRNMPGLLKSVNANKNQ